MTIKIRRDTAANWTSANSILHAGEQGYETDTGKSKIGDGSTHWNSLSYISVTINGTAIPLGSSGTITAAASELVLLGSATASTSASLSFLSMMSSAYSSYLMVLNGLIFDTNGTYFVLRTSENNSTFDATSSHYSSTIIYYSAGGGPTVSSGAVTTGTCLGRNTQGKLNAVNGWIRITPGSDGGSTTSDLIASFYSEIFYSGTSGNSDMGLTQAFGQNVSGTGTVNAVQLLNVGGNITSGTVYMYGIKNT